MIRIRNYNPTLRTGTLDVLIREYLKDRIAFLGDEFKRTVLAENLEDLAVLANRVRSNLNGAVSYGNAKRVDQLLSCAGAIRRGDVPHVIGRSYDFIALARHLADTSCFEMDNNMIVVDEDEMYRLAKTNEARYVSITREGKKMTETVKWSGRGPVDHSYYEGTTVVTYEEEDAEETQGRREGVSDR